MTTQPGDLVLDPTGGSGSTAIVAETWGRRWISIDSSRDAVAIARERLLTTEYPAYLLLDTRVGREEDRKLREAHHEALLEEDHAAEDGADPGRGFVLERQAKVTAATLAYADRPDKAHHQEVIHHVNRPVPAKGVTRVASPFTIDSERLVRYMTPDEAPGSVPLRRRAIRSGRSAAPARSEPSASGGGTAAGSTSRTSSRSTRHARATPRSA